MSHFGKQLKHIGNLTFGPVLRIIHPPLYSLWLLEQIINYIAARGAPMNLSYAEMKLR